VELVHDLQRRWHADLRIVGEHARVGKRDLQFGKPVVVVVPDVAVVGFGFLVGEQQR
jgi:hypothetical protein